MKARGVGLLVFTRRDRKVDYRLPLFDVLRWNSVDG